MAGNIGIAAGHGGPGSRMSRLPELPAWRLAAQLKAFVGFEHGLEIGPLHFVHFIERIEIDGDDFRGYLVITASTAA